MAISASQSRLDKSKGENIEKLSKPKANSRQPLAAASSASNLAKPPPVRKAFKAASEKTLNDISASKVDAEAQQEYEDDQEEDTDSDDDQQIPGSKQEGPPAEALPKQKKKRLKKYELFERSVGKSLGVKRTSLGGGVSSIAPVLLSKPFSIPITGGATTRRKSAGIKNIPGIRAPLKPRVDTSAVQEMTAKPFKVNLIIRHSR